MHEKIYFLINPWSHFNRLYHSLYVNRSACKLQYLKSNSRILYSRNNNFSAFSPSRLLRRSEWICPAALNSCSSSCQHLLVAPTRIFWREVLLTQADCSSKDSRLRLLSAYCLCVWRCRQRLYATAGDSRVLPAVHWLSQSTDFLFLFYLTAILVPKKEKKRKCGCLSAEK